MSDDAYIPPSERRIASEESLTVPCGCGSCLSCEFGYGTKTIHRRLTIDDHGLKASHAVVDSVAADLAERMRPLIEFAERTAIDYDDLSARNACEQARSTLARYDALHKEAGQ